MKKRSGNCNHGLSLDVRSSDCCCLVCNSPIIGDDFSSSIKEIVMSSQIMQYFSYIHLPDNLRDISKRVFLLAEEMEKLLPDCAEKSAGLRKLLEAKDCFVRAKISDFNHQK